MLGVWQRVSLASALLAVIVRPSPAVAAPPGEAPGPGGIVVVQSWTNAKDGQELVLVPGGPFLMGSDKDEPAEKPAHRVDLGAFYMARTPVTVGQFRRFVQESGYRTPANWRGYARDERAPVVCIAWHDAQAYCQWAGLSLPTEAQWEKAARGTDGRAYPWGNEWAPGPYTTDGQTSEFSFARPAGSVPANASPFACLDMGTGVWEWTRSLYYAYPYNWSDGREVATSTQPRAVRGRGWNGVRILPALARTSTRFGIAPDAKRNVLGFRCAAGEIRFNVDLAEVDVQTAIKQLFDQAAARYLLEDSIKRKVSLKATCQPFSAVLAALLDPDLTYVSENGTYRIVSLEKRLRALIDLATAQIEEHNRIARQLSQGLPNPPAGATRSERIAINMASGSMRRDAGAQTQLAIQAMDARDRARYDLARFYSRVGRKDEAISLLRLVIQSQPAGSLWSASAAQLRQLGVRVDVTPPAQRILRNPAMSGGY